MNRKFVIKKNHMFSVVFKKGRYASNGYLTVYILKNYKKGENTKLGISVSAKLGGAVQRNRAKRIIRAAYAKLYGRLSAGYFIVIMARAPCYDKNTKSTVLYGQMKNLFEKLSLM